MKKKYFINRNGTVSGPFPIDIIWLYKDENLQISEDCKKWLETERVPELNAEINLLKHNNEIIKNSLELNTPFKDCSVCGKPAPLFYASYKNKKYYCPVCDFNESKKNPKPALNFPIKRILAASLIFDIAVFLSYVFFFPVNNKIGVSVFNSAEFYSPPNSYFKKILNGYFPVSKNFESVDFDSVIRTNSEISCGDTGYISLNISGNIIKCFRNTIIKLETYNLDFLRKLLGWLPGIDCGLKKIRITLINGRLALKNRNGLISEIKIRGKVFNISNSKSSVMFVSDALDGYYYDSEKYYDFYNNLKDYPVKIIAVKGGCVYNSQTVNDGFYALQNGILVKEDNKITKYIFDKTAGLFKNLNRSYQPNFSFSSKTIESAEIRLPYFLDNREQLDLLLNLNVHPVYKIAAYKILRETAISENIRNAAEIELEKIEKKYSIEKEIVKKNILKDLTPKPNLEKNNSSPDTKIEIEIRSRKN